MPHRDLPVHKRVFELLKAAAKEFGNDMATRFGAALSFYTLFSLVPLLILVVGVVGYVSSASAFVPGGSDPNCDYAGESVVEIAGPNPENPLDRLIVQVDEVAGPQISTQIATLTCQAAESRSSALWIGIILAAFTGSSVFLHVQGILNFIFHTPESRTKGLVNTLVQRGIAVGWAFLLATFVLVPLAAVAAVNVIRNLVPEGLRPVLGVAVPLVSLGVLIVVVSLTFQLLVRTKIPWKAARRGGLFTAIIGLVGAFGVGVYLRSPIASGGALGALGGAAILLFFFNLMWIIYLFGAEVTKVYSDFLDHGDFSSPSDRADRLREEEIATLATNREAAEASLFSGGVGAFLIGLVTGWIARRK